MSHRRPSTRARARLDLVRAHGVEPGAYLLVTAHRAGNVDDPARLAELVSLLLRARAAARAAPSPADAGAPAGRPGCCNDCAHQDRIHLDPAARIPRSSTALLCNAAARPDRFRRAPEGGLPRRGPLRDAAAQHRMGRDGRTRLERARRPRRVTPRAAPSPRSRGRRRASGRPSMAMAMPESAWSRRCGRHSVRDAGSSPTVSPSSEPTPKLGRSR